MKEFTAYDLKTGAVLYSGKARHVEDQLEEGVGVVEGAGSPLTHHVVNGRLRLLRKNIRERNIKNRALRRLRSQRDAKLRKIVQSINPIRWASMTPAQQAAWQDYRQALLDLPQTQKDLDNIQWPEPPDSI